jgi:hypothetical protein
MKQYGVALTAVVLSLGMASAATAEVPSNPGVVKPGSPMYGLDQTWDRLTKSKGMIAYERASEVQWAVDRNQSEEADQARKLVRNAASKATNESRTGLVMAERVLTRVKNRTEKDVPGLNNALEQVRRAQDRQPENKGLLAGSKTQNRSKDGLLPDIGPGKNGNGR